MAATPRRLLKNVPPDLAEARPTTYIQVINGGLFWSVRISNRIRRRHAAPQGVARRVFRVLAPKSPDSRVVSLGNGCTRHGSFTIEEFREGMRRRRRLMIRFGSQNWIRQSAHPRHYARITWFKLGFWDCLG